jgi:hypothetical protein
VKVSVVAPATQVTVVAPSANVDPDGGVQVTVTPGWSTVAMKLTTAPAALVASASMSCSGGVKTGGTGAETVT